MKNFKIKMVTGALMVVFSGFAMAQLPATNIIQPQVVKPPLTTSIINTSSTTNIASGTNTSAVKENALEKELTPLLRQLSTKKTLLELKKIDKEIEKLDEPAPSANGGSTSGPMGGITPMAMPPGGLPSMQTNTGLPASDVPNLRVLMVYGVDNVLYAKLSMGKQGGYVVKKGDIAPNGKTVVKITKTFIELKDEVNNSGNERVFVSISPAASGANGGATDTAKGDSTSYTPPLPSNGITGMLSTLPVSVPATK